MIVRSFESTDAEADAVVALWDVCGLTRPWNDPRADIARKMTTQPELFLVAEDSGRVVGTVMAGYDGHRGWVNYLAVDPVAQRGGIGRALMTAAEQALLARGCPKLNLQVRVGNDAALAFYRRLGYAVDDVTSMGKRLIPDA